MLRQITAALLFAGWLAQSTSAQSTINTGNRFAYGANIGWQDWRVDGANGAVLGEYVCTGYIYAANVGWINLGGGIPANGIHYQNNSASDFGVNHDGLGNLRGYAWGANIGWVNFENQGAPRLDLGTGKLIGSIYSANVGWISLSNAFAFVQTDTLRRGVDSDGDGIPDAYELTWTGNLTTMNSTSDLDHDGVTDRDEYLAGTDPTNPLDRFAILSYTLGTDSLTWTSHPSRRYKIQERLSLSPFISWVDSSLGLVTPDPGATTTRSGFSLRTSQHFFRVEAFQPLVP